MGYTTEFEGTLKFITPMTGESLAYLNEILGCDPDDKPEFKRSAELSYIQYELTKDFTGIKWDGGEKFYHAENACNFIIENMKEKYPDFGLEGELLAQGEEVGDVWKLAIVDGKAVRLEVIMSGQKVTCPHCDEAFILED